MRTSMLSQIMRQKDPELLKAVEHLAKGETEVGVKLLADQGRITEIATPKERIAAIARDYAVSPHNTLIISPDNRSRVAINEAVRLELQTIGALVKDSKQFTTLTHRSDMTGADRMWAARYHSGDVLLYTTGSKAHGIERGSYATVHSVNAVTNTITVHREDGPVVSYDPKRLKGVNVYRQALREIAVGERIQFTAHKKHPMVANRDLATVTKVEVDYLTVQTDSKENCSLTFDPKKMRHFDHGYAVTSHSAQGLTAGRILVNIDGEGARSLVNARLAYVAISRASDDARIYTDNAINLGQRLAANTNKTAAITFSPPAQRVQTRVKFERRDEPQDRSLAQDWTERVPSKIALEDSIGMSH